MWERWPAVAVPATRTARRERRWMIRRAPAGGRAVRPEDPPAYGKLTAARALVASAVRSAFSRTWCHELAGAGRLAELILIREQGEDEGHAGPFSWLAFGLDASAVGFGNGLGNGEAKSVTRLLDAVQPVEALEDVR